MNEKMRVTVIATGFNASNDQKIEKSENIKIEPNEKPVSRFTEQTVMSFNQETKISDPVEAFASMNPKLNNDDSSNRMKEQTASQTKNRIPLFSGEDRTIPAYIRRLEDN